jgi:protein-disulfide isomerase
MTNAISRAQFLRLSALSATMLVVSRNAWAQDEKITREVVYNDPDAPTAGNPNGDLTIVDFFDYNCPYCKMAAKSLEKVVKNDGNIRLVYRDWPVLTDTSIVGARLALGAKYQNKYLSAHHAMMNIPGYGIPRETMIAAVRGSGVDIARLNSDMAAHGPDIEKLVKRNLAIADIIGLQGPPGFLIGPFQVNEALNEASFKQVIADARAPENGVPR